MEKYDSEEKNAVGAVTSAISITPSVPSEEYDPINNAIAAVISTDEYAAMHVEDDSPYPEVRACVPATDDPTLPQNTLRMWVLGMIFTTIGSGMNMLFSLHLPSVTITTYVTSILAFPVGKAWARWMPNYKIFGMELNPGPFNLKEHSIITIMGNVSLSGGNTYATDILLAQNRFYGSDFGVGFAVVASLATQVIGLSLAGMGRRVLVDSASAIWPSNLVSATFITNLHVNENHVANGWKISRYAFFALVFTTCFFWEFIPQYMFTGLSYFAWPTWIAPNNIKLNQVFGCTSGMGLMPISMDWMQIAGYTGLPLVPPATTIMTIFGSIVVLFWIVAPGIYYSNSWYSKYMPMTSLDSYDRYQGIYNVLRVMDTTSLTLNEKAYKAYSPLFISTTFGLAYGMSFAGIIATVTHTVCFHGKEIVKQIKSQGKPDVHFRLMKQNYRGIPEWWYAVLFLVAFALSVVTVRCWPTEMPVWSLVLAIIILAVFLIPVGVIYALTNINIGLNVLAEFIIGYMLPGKPLAMMFFKTFGYITNSQAVTFAQDMKLGHYMKIQPRLLFWAQLVATVWSALVQVGVLRWSYGAIDNLCSQDQKDHYTCPNGRVFFNASIIWGAIGPKRVFSKGGIYYQTLFFHLLGLLPVVNWLVLKKWPKSSIRWLNWPVFFMGTGMIPPATPFNYASYCMVGLFFSVFIKKRWTHWYFKYNYSLSAGLDIGMAWSSLIIFLTLYMTNTNFPSWWGNNVVNDTLDTNFGAISNMLKPGEAFGPETW